MSIIKGLLFWFGYLIYTFILFFFGGMGYENTSKKSKRKKK